MGALYVGLALVVLVCMYYSIHLSHTDLFQQLKANDAHTHSYSSNKYTYIYVCVYMFSSLENLLGQLGNSTS